MEKINRENLVNTLNAVKTRIKEAKKRKFVYKTGERYLTGWAVISCIDDYKTLIEVLAYLQSQMANIDSAASALGIDITTLHEVNDEDFDDEDFDADDEDNGANGPTLCGYPVADWIEDVKTRKAELDTIAEIEKLMKAKALIENNLSEDDRFSIQMEQVANLLG